MSDNDDEEYDVKFDSPKRDSNDPKVSFNFFSGNQNMFFDKTNIFLKLSFYQCTEPLSTIVLTPSAKILAMK